MLFPKEFSKLYGTFSPTHLKWSGTGSMILQGLIAGIAVAGEGFMFARAVPERKASPSPWLA